MAYFPGTVSEIEKNLSVMTSVASESSSIEIDPLRIVASTESLLFESSLIYWMSTQWHRYPDGDRFNISAQSPEQGLHACLQSLPGLMLTLLPPGKVTGFSKKLVSDFRGKYFSGQRTWPDLALSNRAWIACLDGYAGGLPTQLYQDPETETLIDPFVFRSLTKTLLASVVEVERVQGLLKDKLEAISSILYELFKNTHQHARRWIQGEHIPSSFRGLYLHFYSTESVLNNRNENLDQPLQNFLRSLLSPSRTEARDGHVVSQNLDGLLEISVFDTGPGLAQRWLGRATSYDEPEKELEALIKCFKKGGSSTSDPTRGYGLSRVLGLLRSLKGFIRIRTNHLHVYRGFSNLVDFRLSRPVDNAEIPEALMFDWNRGISSTPSSNPESRGVVLSILVPLFK